MLTAYKAAGLEIPHSCSMLSSMGKKIPVDPDKIEVGDLVFFSWNSSTKPTHVGMVIETGDKSSIRFIHASSSRGVVEDHLFSNYYGKHIVQVRRLLGKNS
jgi:cell wall-associated NlpC family hydrolase